MGGRYFPVSLDIQGKRCLIIGGGCEALGKCQSLLAAGAKVHVVSPVFLSEFALLEAEGLITRKFRPYRPADLKGYFLAFACTGSVSVNQEVADEARRLGVLLNVVDQPERCDFIMPAVVRNGSLTVSVTTDGKSPALARLIKEELAGQFGERHATFLDLLGELRPIVQKAGLDHRQRGELFSRLVRSTALQRLQAGERAGMYEIIISLLNEYGVPSPTEWSPNSFREGV